MVTYLIKLVNKESNKMYKTETHLHVAEISGCSRIKAAEMVKLHSEAGYKTICVSDHLNQIFLDSLGDIPWEDKMTIFLSGYYKAKEAGKKYGINVIMSAEIMFEESKNHYLVYGATKEFLASYPNICKMSVKDFYKIAKEHNVFVVQAHPFRDEICFPTPEYVDAMEVYNSNPRHVDFSEKTAECVKVNGLYMTSGSDSHRLEDIGKGGILSEQEIKSAEDFITLIKSGNAVIFKG